MSVFSEPTIAARTDWETPQWLFDHLDQEFNFTVDVCADKSNTKLTSYFDVEQNGLSKSWSGICWMNPPYGREISGWIQKAYLSAKRGDATVVCLLPARSNCDWWRWVIYGEVRFIRRKLRFVGGTSVSMFPNVIVIFRPHLERGGTMSILDIREPR